MGGGQILYLHGGGIYTLPEWERDIHFTWMGEGHTLYLDRRGTCTLTVWESDMYINCMREGHMYFTWIGEGHALYLAGRGAYIVPGQERDLHFTWRGEGHTLYLDGRGTYTLPGRERDIHFTWMSRVNLCLSAAGLPLLPGYSQSRSRPSKLRSLRYFIVESINSWAMARRRKFTGGLVFTPYQSIWILCMIMWGDCI